MLVDRFGSRRDWDIEAAKVVVAEPHSYCDISARVQETTRIEVRLPITGWNRDFYMAGCGGMCGSLDSIEQVRGMTRGLERGYAVSTMDTGHSGTVFDARFADGNKRGREDFAYRSVHNAAVASKQIIRLYYGRAARHAFFEGCSTGGRQGLMEAQRFPGDFDGIIAGSPAFDSAGLVTYWTWIAQADRGRDGWIMTPSAVQLLETSVASLCADQDGVVQDPRRCRFDPSQLSCRPDGGSQSCLTSAQLGVVRRWYEGPRGADGHRLFEGVPPGSEAFWQRAGMPPVLGPVMNFQKAAAGLGLQHLMIDPAPGDNYDILSFRIDRDRGRLRAADAYMTPEPRLSAFAAHGGKLLIYQGWADAITPPLRPIAFYQELQKRLGKDVAVRHVRLFMVPGFNHCGGPAMRSSPGITASGIDPLSALELWTVTRRPPDILLGSKLDAGGAEMWRRPICRFPGQARFTGGGDRNAADSWHCAFIRPTR